MSDSTTYIVPWRTVASTVNLCDRCRAFYANARFCDECLRDANADPTKKRGILFPPAHDATDAPFAIA